MRLTARGRRFREPACGLQSDPGFRDRQGRSTTSAATCSVPNAFSRNPTARCGPPTRAAASSGIAPDGRSGRSSRRRRSGHFPRPAARRRDISKGTLPNGLAFARNGDFLISNFGTDCLEVMSRDGATRRARRHDRRPADRQGELRPARLARIASGSRCRRGSRTGCTRCAPIWPTATSRATRTAHSASSPTASGFTNEIRFDANEEFLYVVETTGGLHHAAAHRRTRRRREREIFGPSTLGQGRMARRHRVRQLRQPLGHAGLLGQAVRADAGGRSARPARRRRSAEGGRAGARVLQQRR